MSNCSGNFNGPLFRPDCDNHFLIVDIIGDLQDRDAVVLIDEYLRAKVRREIVCCLSGHGIKRRPRSPSGYTHPIGTAEDGTGPLYLGYHAFRCNAKLSQRRRVKNTCQSGQGKLKSWAVIIFSAWICAMASSALVSSASSLRFIASSDMISASYCCDVFMDKKSPATCQPPQK